MRGTKVSRLLASVALAVLLPSCGNDGDSSRRPMATATAAMPTATATAVPTATATAVPTATATAVPTASPEPLDFAATAEDFDCMLDWEPVRKFRITNKLGMLQEALDLAKNPRAGLQFPVGTIVQLFPGEAMVKRGETFDPDNHNWEYFELDTFADRTEIRVRGREDAVNRFGGQCLGCHVAAREFDFLCETGRGCADLGLPPGLIETLQNADPRCGDN